MMKRKVALLMTTVMLATSVFPAGITAYAEEAVPTSEVAVEAALDETLEESADASAVDGDVNVPDENVGTEADAAQVGEDVLSAEDEMIADDMDQDALTEDDSQTAPIMADGDMIVSDVEVVDEVSTVNVADTQDENTVIEIKNVNSEIHVSDENVDENGYIYYSFNAPEEADYTIISFADESIDPDLYFDDEGEEPWDENNDFYRCNFKRSRYLGKNETCCFKIRTYSEDEKEDFNFGIYKTSDIVLANIALSSGTTAPTFIYGIDNFSSYMDKMQDMSFDFSYKTDEIDNEVKLRDLWDEEDRRYLDRYYNEIKFSVDGMSVSDELDEYAFNVNEHELTIEGLKTGGVPFSVININDEDAGVTVTDISGTPETLVDLPKNNDIAYYKFTPEEKGRYVFRRSIGEGIYAVLNSEIELSDDYTWGFNGLQAITMAMEAKDTCYIAIPDAQGGELTIGESQKIKSVKFTEETAGIQQATNVFENGLAYTIEITYQDTSIDPEYIYGQDYLGQSCLQSKRGAELFVSYSANGIDNMRMEYFEDYVPVDTAMNLIIESPQGEELGRKEIKIENDFDNDAELLTFENGLADYTLKEGDKFVKIKGAGEYKHTFFAGEMMPYYYLSDGFMYKGSDYYTEDIFTVEDTVYMDVSNISAGMTMQIRKLRTVESISVQPGSMQLVEGRYTVRTEEDEDGNRDEYKMYMDPASVKLRIKYMDGTEEVSVSEYITSDGRHISYELYKANQLDYDDGVPYDEVIPAGSYALHIWVDGLNPVLLPITVVHDWGAWTTSKKADIYSPETQTSKCAHCGTIGTRTIGSKLAPVLTLTANKLTMKTKQSTSKFKVEAMAAGDALISVTSNNTKLLKVSNVSPNGTFKLKAQNKTGTAKLTITLKSGTSKTIKVKIQKAKVNTTKIKVASKKLTLSKKQKYNLAAVVTPVTSYDKVKYTSSNKKVATVSKKGQVTAKNKGSATITVKSGKKSVKVKVTVK